MRTHGQTRYPQSSPHLVKKDRATKKLLDKFLCNRKKSSLKTTYNQTVEAEVKVAVRAQRVRDVGIRIELQTTKWTAEGAPNFWTFNLGMLD